LSVVETSSTNSEILALAKLGEAEGLWIRADFQTAGRGRLGRDWVSPRGNLYASGLVRLRAGDPPAPTLGFVAALALQKILAIYAHDAAVNIKWPNDVMANGAKISGILLERAGDAVVVGVGVNLVSHPAIADRQTTSIADLTGSAPEPAIFLDHLVEVFEHVLGEWRSAGLGPILAKWEAHAHPVGAALKVSLPDGDTVDGLFGGLDSDGALRLRLADGSVRVIHAGDVFLI
jgi:BirA family transcriptional regulator, biotin operon repressor / biotin---[acetyl-CoA-carboxylase] ligase